MLLAGANDLVALDDPISIRQNFVDDDAVGLSLQKGSIEGAARAPFFKVVAGLSDNSPFVRLQADLWAKRVCAQVKLPKERIITMYESAFARPPADAEVNACLEFVTRQAQLDNRNAEDAAVWASLAHALFNTKEFIYLP